MYRCCELGWDGEPAQERGRGLMYKFGSENNSIS